MSTQWPAIAYSASNRVVFSGIVAPTRQPEFFNSIMCLSNGKYLLRKRRNASRAYGLVFWRQVRPKRRQCQQPQPRLLPGGSQNIAVTR